MKQLPVSEVRRRLPALAREVAATGEEVVITRRGRPLVRIVPLRQHSESQPDLPLRGLPLEMAADFDVPMEHLWEAVDEVGRA